ncbi:MAG: carboxypeptidase-like regulatory domain-containing protein [Candidatus Aminicenantales bacterium]
MLNFGIFRSRLMVVCVMAAFIMLLTPVKEFASQTAPKGGALTGQVFGADMKTPVANATVKIRNLNTQKEFTSPTDKMGMFSITGIDEGWYTLGVSSSLGDYNLNYGVYIKTGETAKLSLSMKGAGVLEGKGLGSSAPKGFFGTPAGILVIVAAAGGVGFGVYELTKKKTEASPVR